MPLATTEAAPGPVAPTTGLWWREAAGAFADLGVLVPIAAALIVVNGLSPTAVLLPAGVAYLAVARVYGVPVSVQPLKAFGAVAIAAGVGSDVIAAGALLLGGLFLLLGSGPLLDRIGTWFPRPVVRGIQLSVGLIFARIAYGMVTSAQPQFWNQWPQPWLAVAAAATLAALLLLRGRVVLPVLAVAVVVAASAAAGSADLQWGPSPLQLPELSGSAFATAVVLLVVPQVPLTLANSCIAPADAARTYFGDAADRVTPARLARTLGSANLLAGAVSGMPVCHGAGGISAHHAFGARTWRAPVVIGATLVVVALVAGSALAVLLPAFPLPLLAALLAVAALVHVGLLRDLRGAPEWAVAVGVGLLGAATNLAVAVVLGLLAAWVLDRWTARRRP
jgi:hypothetical protein